jgi:hypothetical protein
MSACGIESRMRAEFKLGSLEQREYSIGDQLDWSGPIRDHDPPVDGYAAGYGLAECLQCDGDFWVWVTVEGDVIQRVESSTGPDPHSGEG